MLGRQAACVPTEISVFIFQNKNKNFAVLFFFSDFSDGADFDLDPSSSHYGSAGQKQQQQQVNEMNFCFLKFIKKNLMKLQIFFLSGQ